MKIPKKICEELSISRLMILAEYFFSLEIREIHILLNQIYAVMKTLVEYMNETLENTLELEIAKILSDEQEEAENETSNDENDN